MARGDRQPATSTVGEWTESTVGYVELTHEMCVGVQTDGHDWALGPERDRKMPDRGF